MKNIVLCFLFIVCFIDISATAQEKFTLNGTISEEKSNETLIGVSIVFPEAKTGTTTNEYGFYSITLPKGTYKVVISYLGFSTKVETVVLTENITKNFSLTDTLENLDEIVITGNVEKTNLKAPQMSVNRLTASTIKQIPVV
ncbi:MAG TPA: carboxypeptidase-like regulatory domain-containing protein, partial [Mariniflexile sp.]|nr:carboxypeptidase-like regulatory domain-containing protein [Mariniflexile sp.]